MGKLIQTSTNRRLAIIASTALLAVLAMGTPTQAASDSKPAGKAETDLSRRVLEALASSSKSDDAKASAAQESSRPATPSRGETGAIVADPPQQDAPAKSPTSADAPVASDVPVPMPPARKLSAPVKPQSVTSTSQAPAAAATPSNSGNVVTPAPAAAGSTPQSQPTAVVPPSAGGNAAGAEAEARVTVARPAQPAAPSTSAPVSVPSTAERSYTIQQGDTFSSIAVERFGHEKFWTAIAQANPLVDPTRLKVGQKIRLPELGTLSHERDRQLNEIRSTVSRKGEGSVLVQPGDTLSHIAGRVYGRSSLWPVIYRANRDVLQSPDDVKPGMKLRIPPKPTLRQ